MYLLVVRADDFVKESSVLRALNIHKSFQDNLVRLWISGRTCIFPMIVNYISKRYPDLTICSVKRWNLETFFNIPEKRKAMIFQSAPSTKARSHHPSTDLLNIRTCPSPSEALLLLFVVFEIHDLISFRFYHDLFVILFFLCWTITATVNLNFILF